MSKALSITAIIAARNEAVNLPKCLNSLDRAKEIYVIDSNSSDGTEVIAKNLGAKVEQFRWTGGYPKKRQWALETLPINTDWVMLLDADEIVPDRLWEEISLFIGQKITPSAFMIEKGFHFLGKRMRFGGFSHSAVVLFKLNSARFERLFDDFDSGLDMEVHERLKVDGEIVRLSNPLIHEDFKGLAAYIEKHNRYSTWEARLRDKFLESGRYGEDSIEPSFVGNTQELRRALKQVVMRAPFEPQLWFIYHYFARLAFLEGRRGLIASQIRAQYISNVRAKIYEINLGRSQARSH
jgi:glycosyltransferase involved in cell wall biosynthesis